MAQGNLLNIGWGRQNITPRFATPLAGFVRREEKSTEIVADPLFVRAVIMKSGRGKALLLSFDLLGFNREVSGALRAKIRENTDFEDEEIILACTHTHSAPPTIELTKSGKINPVYIHLLIERTSMAVREAMGKNYTVCCRYTSFHLPEVSVNRRDSSRATNDLLSLLQFQEDGRTLGTIIHYSAHPNSVCENRISADYPGYICRQLENELGLPFAFFLLGAAGDTNLLINEFSYREMEQFGQIIFESIRTNLDRGELIDTDAIDLHSSELTVYLEPYTNIKRLTRKIKDINDFIIRYIRMEPRKHLKKNLIYRTVSQILDKKDLSDGDAETVHFVALALLENNQKNLSALTKNSPRSAQVRVQFLSLGGVIFAFVGAELFSNSDFELQSRFSGRKILLCGYLDPLIGYISPAEEYEKGGYEIDEAFLFFGVNIPFGKDTEKYLLSYLTDRLEAFFDSSTFSGGEHEK
ncbi:MAG: hypothetical protein V3V57_05355 [Spirochaetia bacterium]